MVFLLLAVGIKNGPLCAIQNWTQEMWQYGGWKLYAEVELLKFLY